QPEHAALGLLGTDELRRPHRLGTQVAPVPHPRHGLALGLPGDTAPDPGRRDVLGSELRVVVLQFGFRRLDVGELHRQSSPSPPVARIWPTPPFGERILTEQWWSRERPKPVLTSSARRR